MSYFVGLWIITVKPLILKYMLLFISFKLTSLYSTLLRFYDVSLFYSSLRKQFGEKQHTYPPDKIFSDRVRSLTNSLQPLNKNFEHPIFLFLFLIPESAFLLMKTKVVQKLDDSLVLQWGENDKIYSCFVFVCFPNRFFIVKILSLANRYP